MLVNFLNSFLIKKFFYLDIPEFNQLGFQDSSNLSANNLALFHDNIMFYLIVILILVG